MTDVRPRSRPPATRPPTTRAVVTVAGVNLLLGVPGVVPVWLASFYLSSWPLAALGLTDRPPTEDDGVGIASLVILPVVGLALLGWILAGRVLRRRTAARSAGWFWPVSAVAALTPSLVLVLVSLAS